MKALISLLVLILLLGCQPPKEATSFTEESATINSEMLGEVLDYRVYRPTGASTEVKTVLYLLHGHGGNHMDWFETGEGHVGQILDSLIGGGHIPPMIAVSLDAGNSWYVDRPAPMRQFYLDEFMPFIEDTYFSKEPENRLIAGNSAGGYGTLGLIMSSPERFDAAILLSPAAYDPLPPAISSSRKVAAFMMDGVFNDSVWQQLSYRHDWPGKLSPDNSPYIHLSVGDDDAYNIVPVVSQLQQLLLDEDIANDLRITDGGHDWECWKTNFTSALLQYYTP